MLSREDVVEIVAWHRRGWSVSAMVGALSHSGRICAVLAEGEDFAPGRWRSTGCCARWAAPPGVGALTR
jgi:hypothetical protein